MAHLRSYQIDQTLVFEFHGEHDISTVHRIETSVAAATGTQPRVIFDLSTVRYVDSTFLAFLIRRWKELGNKMAVVVPAYSPLRKIFSVTQLEHYLPVVETLAQANRSE